MLSSGVRAPYSAVSDTPSASSVSCAASFCDSPSAFSSVPSVSSALPISASGLREREAAYAARWAAGAWRGATLTPTAGDAYAVVYEGHRGGAAGPDFRDAVLVDGHGERVRGDVELHLRASGWRLHGHDRDPRYDGVLLHLVVHPPREPETAGSPLPGGRRVPIALIGPPPSTPACPLPCAGCHTRLGAQGIRALLATAGDARFEWHEGLLRRATREEATRTGQWDAANRALAVALAEALGYGRDRALLRAAGERIARGGMASTAGDVGEGDVPAIERARLRGLRALFSRWEARGPWQALRGALATGTPRAAGEALVAALAVPGGDVSRGRALILAANVALPFAAVAEPALANRARVIYAALPGLPSNATTRLMTAQLSMPRLPSGARAQQGLHHLWQTVCRDKRCAECPCAPCCNVPADDRLGDEPKHAQEEA